MLTNDRHLKKAQRCTTGETDYNQDEDSSLNKSVNNNNSSFWKFRQKCQK